MNKVDAQHHPTGSYTHMHRTMPTLSTYISTINNGTYRGSKLFAYTRQQNSDNEFKTCTKRCRSSRPNEVGI